MPSDATQSLPDRPVRPALFRGWRRVCPNCGAGPLFKGYLKVRSECPSCKQDLTHQRADDGPAYITILLIGHLMAPLLHILYARYQLEPLVLATILSVACVALALYLLPRIKGAMIGLQWAKRMHGFGRES